MVGVGPSHDYSQACQTVVSYLKTGLLSTQDRFSSGMFISGASSDDDLASGGGDQVFTRMITDKLSDAETSEFKFSGALQVLVDLEVVNRGAYAYSWDNLGCKNESSVYEDIYFDSYAKRKNLVDFVKNLQAEDTENEVMVKNRIAPNFIRAVVVGSEEEKSQLLKILKDNGLIEVVDGVEYVKGPKIPVNVFIQIPDDLSSQKFNKEMWGGK